MSLCLGFLTGLFIGQLYDMHWVLHDVMAYPLLAAVSCMSVVDPGARQRLRRVAWLMITFGTACLALQVAAGWKIIDIPLVQPWYWERFRGWSAIPNQLSLLCVVLALLSVHLAETAAGWSRPNCRLGLLNSANLCRPDDHERHLYPGARGIRASFSFPEDLVVAALVETRATYAFCIRMHPRLRSAAVADLARSFG